MNNDYNNQNYNNQYQNDNNQNQNYNNQNMNYNNYYNPQQPMNNNYTPEDAKSDQTKLIIGIVLLVAGWFFAGIICGTGAIIMSTQIKKKSAGKTVILVLGIIEIVLTIIGVFASLFLQLA